MTERLLDYLTRPNPTVRVESEGRTTFTYNVQWQPIENIERWDEFNYQTLTTRFRIQLDRLVTLPDVTRQCEEARFNRLYDETMLGHLVASSIMLNVSSALPSNLFLVAGGATLESDACVPDWGAGKTNTPQNQRQRSKAILLGDTKYRWSHQRAVDVVRSSRHGYNNEDVVRPIEQVQYYCAMYRCRFGFLITEKGVLVMQFFQERDLQRPPRVPRNIQPSHRRILSDSTMDMSIISESLTDMSVTSQDVSAPTIRLVQYAFVPWEAQGRDKLTVKLALYCITLLATEASELGPDYAPLAPVSQPPLNATPSLNQARTHTASSPRREQPQEQSTGAPKNQCYTDVSLTQHGNFYTFSLDSGPMAKNKDEWREERDYLFHDGLKVKGKKPQSTTAPSSMSTSAGKKPQSTTAPSTMGTSAGKKPQYMTAPSSTGISSGKKPQSTTAPEYTYVGQLLEHEGHYRTSNGSVNLPKKEWTTMGGYCYHEAQKLQGKQP